MNLNEACFAYAEPYPQIGHWKAQEAARKCAWAKALMLTWRRDALDFVCFGGKVGVGALRYKITGDET